MRAVSYAGESPVVPECIVLHPADDVPARFVAIGGSQFTGFGTGVRNRDASYQRAVDVVPGGPVPIELPSVREAAVIQLGRSL